jgi:hypothetical protein
MIEKLEMVEREQNLLTNRTIYVFYSFFLGLMTVQSIVLLNKLIDNNTIPIKLIYDKIYSH